MTVKDDYMGSGLNNGRMKFIDEMGKTVSTRSGGKITGSILQIIMMNYLLDFKWKYPPGSRIYNSRIQQNNEG